LTLLTRGGKDKGIIAQWKLAVIEKGSIWVTRVMPNEYADEVLSFLKTDK